MDLLMRHYALLLLGECIIGEADCLLLSRLQKLIGMLGLAGYGRLWVNSGIHSNLMSSLASDCERVSRGANMWLILLEEGIAKEIA